MAIESTCARGICLGTRTHRYLCAQRPYIPTCMRTCIYMSTYQTYHRDIDIALCIPMHTCPYRAIYTRLHIHPYAHARGDGLQTCADGVADACACAHLGVRTCLDAQTSIQTHSVQMGVPHSRAHAHAHMRTLPRILYMHSYV